MCARRTARPSWKTAERSRLAREITRSEARLREYNTAIRGQAVAGGLEGMCRAVQRAVWYRDEHLPDLAERLAALGSDPGTADTRGWSAAARALLLPLGDPSAEPGAATPPPSADRQRRPRRRA